ncbi:MAG: hypothetical protein Q9200_005846 [Gallowayella weberi]
MASVLPALAFLLDMNSRTGGFFGVNEALFSSALACIVFSILGAQPLTIVGITGLISLFNYTIFDIIKRYDSSLYPEFLAWVAIWAAIFHWLFAIWNLCDYMRYVTDFTSESFGTYVGIIYLVKGVELLIVEFERYGPRKGYLGVVISLLYFFTVYNLQSIGQGTWFKPWIRDFLGDYAFPNQSSVAAQARNFPLKKPGGFHWDFFLLGCTSFVAGIIGIPLPNGLVPQAPVHTESLTEYKRQLTVTRTNDGREIREQVKVAESVVEQRVSHFVMGLAIIGTMTGPLLTVLNLIPRALFGGVFFVVGWGGLEGNGIMKKILYIIREDRFVQPDSPLRQVSNRKILMYLFCQIVGITATVGISQTIAAIGFPVLFLLLIPLRWKVLPKFFTARELSILDHLTADSDIVLASMGGKPRMPEDPTVVKESPGSSKEGEGSGSGSNEKMSMAERGEATGDLRGRSPTSPNVDTI